MPKQGKVARSLDVAVFVISIGTDCVSIARAQHLNKNGVTRAFAPLHYHKYRHEFYQKCFAYLK